MSCVPSLTAIGFSYMASEKVIPNWYFTYTVYNALGSDPYAASYRNRFFLCVVPHRAFAFEKH